MELTDLKPGELDILDGSPPCQGFSTAGKRKLTDSRNQLFKEYVRLLSALQPKVFVMENVSGMVKGKMKLVFAEIMRALKESGYRVSARLMNTKYFQVPQARERMIFIGVREDLGMMPGHPKAQKHPFTAEEAIGDLSTEGLSFFENDKAKELWKRCLPGKPFASVHPKKHWFNQVKASPSKPFPTVIKSLYLSGGAGIAHWKYPAQLSIPMLKRASSFPDEFQLVGKLKEQWARIGNSVPPLFMKAIAEHIKLNILDKINE